jgi:hypothetical protein
VAEVPAAYFAYRIVQRNAGPSYLEFWTPAKRFNRPESMNAQITHWHPIQDFEDLQQRLATVWNPRSPRSSSQEESLTVAQWTPRVDISEDDKEFVLKRQQSPRFDDEGLSQSVRYGPSLIDRRWKICRRTVDLE